MPYWLIICFSMLYLIINGIFFEFWTIVQTNKKTLEDAIVGSQNRLNKSSKKMIRFVDNENDCYSNPYLIR